MSKSKRVKRSPLSIIVKILIAIVIIAAILLITAHFTKEAAVEYASEKVIEEIIKETAVNNGHTEEEVSSILDSIDSSDKEAIENIINAHLDSDLLKRAEQYLIVGDIDGLINMAEKELSQEELDRIEAIYNKYEDIINREYNITPEQVIEVTR